MGILFALASMGFAGANDLIFKKFGEKERSVGIFIGLIGVIWTLVFLGMGLVKGSLHFGAAAFVIGSFAGISSALSNILFIETLKKTGAGVGATVYRLNLIFVALIAFIFLNETFSLMKIIGLGLAIATIFIIFWDSGKTDGNFLGKYILLLVAASMLRACMGISYKLASIYHVSNESFLTVNGFYWFLFGLLYLLFRERTSGVGRSVFKYAAISGALVCGIVLFLRLAVNCGDASVVVTISQLSFLVTFPVSVFLLKETFSAGKGLAVLSAALCILAFAAA